MADDDTLLTLEQKNVAIAWLNERGAREPTCPACGQNTWFIGDHLVAAPVYSGGMIIGGPVYPNFMIICQNCGNTQYFNAVIAKIIESDKEEEEKPADAEKIKEASDG